MEERISSRFTLLVAEQQAVNNSFADCVKDGLSKLNKELEPKYFYDELGSKIFEEITELEEYYPTKAESNILNSHHKEIVRIFHGQELPVMVELGSGSSSKTRKLISSILEEHDKLLYVPIDISETMLKESSLELLDEFPKLSILGVAAEYSQGLKMISEKLKQEPKLILWLGSSIGNLLKSEANEFLTKIKSTMTENDKILIGMDLKKDIKVLLKAYNDSKGVTARFNKNVLTRINSQLKSNFDLDSFRHESVWNEDEGRIEMRLFSEKDQSVYIKSLNMTVNFTEGESIHTENCHKYSLDDIEETARNSGFEVENQWFDLVENKRRFSLNLFSPIAETEA